MLHFEGKFSLSLSAWSGCDPGVPGLRPKNERHRERGGFSPSWESNEDSMVNKGQRSAQHRLYLKMRGAEGVNISSELQSGGKSSQELELRQSSLVVCEQRIMI